MSEGADRESKRSIYDVLDQEEKGESGLSRYGPWMAILTVLLVVLYLSSSGDEYTITAEFENAAQVLEGNEVVIAGAAVGTVKTIELGDDGQALVRFTVNEDFAPLPVGTIATVRSYSLSGIANRQIQLALPPERAGDPDAGAEQEAIPDGGSMSQSETVSEVDLDQIFNTLDDRTVRNLKKVIRGFEISYDGVGEQANRGFRYLNPFLGASRAFFSELNLDEQALSQLLVDTSRLSGAIASRSTDVSALVGNLDAMMGALASQKTALAESVAELPAFMRQSNTTFVNLRAALDDLGPLVEASKPAAVRLQPFLAELRSAVTDAVPTITGLDEVISAPGPANDLIELTAAQVPLEASAIGSGSPECGSDPETDYERAANGDFTEGSFGESVCALRNGLPALAFFRAYTNELVGWFDGFSHSNGTANEGNGTLGRIQAAFNTFSASPISGLPFIGTGNILPTGLDNPTNLDIITTGVLNKCPGANERPLGAVDPDDNTVPFSDGSSPYTDPINCDPSDVAPGP